LGGCRLAGVALMPLPGGARWRPAFVTVNDILDGHVGLDLECFDRIYLNGWVSNLQVSGQVVHFLTQHWGFPIPEGSGFGRGPGRVT
jgi:hypothetical protein